MKVCAIVDRSAGNETVGDMWTETASFEDTATLADVLAWAKIYKQERAPGGCMCRRVDTRANVRLATLQEPAQEDGKPEGESLQETLDRMDGYGIDNECGARG